MKRIFTLALIAGVAVFVGGKTATAKDGTFSVPVSGIAEFIDSVEDDATGSAIDTWDVDVNAGSGTSADKSDAVIIFRLVMNQDTTLAGSFATPLQLETATSGAYNTLLTYANIESDGDGTGTPSAGTGHDTATAKSGFSSGVEDEDVGIGSGNYAYVGGLATSATVPTLGGTYGVTTGGAAVFLGASGTSIKHIGKDGAVQLTVTVRGMNGEDFGADSDSTEAPDEGTYTTVL